MIENLTKIPLFKFPNFIEGIRFPFYKAIEKDEKLDFHFPFTVIVGPNGCGKTSILHALYGCPHGMSTADFWFSTEIDPINDNETGPPRFIYKYKPEGLKYSVEAIKTWRKRTSRPDYWEPSRARKSDGMLDFPGQDKLSEKARKHASTDRWNQIQKNVVYISFKAELSAFDKFMNFGHFEPTRTIKTKQDKMRIRSKPLKKALESTNLNGTEWFKKTCKKKYNVSDRTLQVCSNILGKNYHSAIFLEHDYFDNNGVSISFKESANNYSEALAGSGEVAIFCLVEKIINAKPSSLILLDEPEVSLHPGAQRQLRNFILEEIITKKHQVVITSHSPTLIEGLPKSAIKLLTKDHTTGKFKISNTATEEQAFSRLGNFNKNKTIIIVEDELAKTLVEKAIKQLDEQLLLNIDVTPYIGGGETIKQNFINILSLDNIHNVKVFLDGDQKKHTTIINQNEIPLSENDKLENKLYDYVGFKVRLPLNGGDGANKNHEDKAKTIRKAFDVYNENFYFGNTETPEELLCEIFHDKEEFIKHSNEKDYKERFKQITLDAVDESTAQEILSEQKRWIKKIPDSNEHWIEFKMIIAKILDI